MFLDLIFLKSMNKNIKKSSNWKKIEKKFLQWKHPIIFFRAPYKNAVWYQMPSSNQITFKTRPICVADWTACLWALFKLVLINFEHITCGIVSNAFVKSNYL